MNFQEAQSTWRADRAQLERAGVIMPDVTTYLPDEWRHDYTIAMDAQPTLFTTPNSAIPALFTTSVDPEVVEILFAPTKAAEILGEVQRGTWLDDLILFPVVEATGEVSSYGDYNNNGRAGVNASWPQRQNYRFQLIKEYGEFEMARADLAKLNWVSSIDKAAAGTMNKFMNYSYFFGVQGLQNYGLLNDPSLSAAIAPATKAAGGTAWVLSGYVNATANEIYADIEALFQRLVNQTAGLVQQDTPMVLAYGTAVASALTATNSFNVNVSDLLKKNFPNLTLVQAVQYNALSALNPQGVAAGNFVQLMAATLEGQKSFFAAYSEKMRSHPVIRHMSSFRQKVSGATWGSVIKMPASVVSMVGV